MNNNKNKYLLYGFLLLGFSIICFTFLPPGPNRTPLEVKKNSVFKKNNKGILNGDLAKNTLSANIVTEKIENETEFLTNGKLDFDKLDKKILEDEIKAAGGIEAYKKSHVYKMRSQDLNITINIDEYQENLQNIMREQLAFVKEHGYSKISTKEMDEVYNVKQRLFGHEKPDLKVKFTLSKLPSDLQDSYVGYTIDDIPPSLPSDFKSNAITRIFDYKNDVVLLSEVNKKYGVSHFVTEFINLKVRDKPAMLSVMRDPRNRELLSVSWITKNYVFDLQLITNKPKPIAEELLKTLATSIDAENLQ